MKFVVCFVDVLFKSFQLKINLESFLAAYKTYCFLILFSGISFFS